MVADPRGAGVAGSEGRVSAQARTVGRINAPSSARVETAFDGTPREVNHQPVLVLREEWRVLDRWWTSEPVSRRYFDLVLESGEHAVVFRDEASGRWFSQRGA